MPFLSHADEIVEIINVEIDISWNLTSVNSNTKAPFSNGETPTSTNLNATPGRITAVVVSSGSGGQIRIASVFT